MMKRVILFGLFFTFLFLPNFAIANVVVSGPISSDTTWSPENGVYINVILIGVSVYLWSHAFDNFDMML